MKFQLKICIGIFLAIPVSSILADSVNFDTPVALPAVANQESSSVAGISSAGVAGYVLLPQGLTSNAVIWQQSQAILLPTPTNWNSVAIGINASADIVGAI